MQPYCDSYLPHSNIARCSLLFYIYGFAAFTIIVAITRPIIELITSTIETCPIAVSMVGGNSPKTSLCSLLAICTITRVIRDYWNGQGHRIWYEQRKSLQEVLWPTIGH